MISRRIARPLLSSIFITGGIDALRNPGPRAQAAEPVIDLLAETAAPVAKKMAAAVVGAADAAEGGLDAALSASPLNEHDRVAQTASATAHQINETVHGLAGGKPVPFDNETYVRINGAVQVGAGVLLAFGRVPRLASAALAASLIPTTFGGHRFWELNGDAKKAQQVQFAKNMSLLGGLVLAATDTGAAPTIAWRVSHRGKKSRTGAADAKAVERLTIANAKLVGTGGQLAVESITQHAGTGWRVARRRGRAAARFARTGRSEGAEMLNHFGSAVADRASDLAPVAHSAVNRVVDAANELGPKVHAATERASELTTDLGPRAQALGHRVAGTLPVGT